MSLQTPITFCIFNRPELTRTVFDQIALQRPRQLLIVADGARTDVPCEAGRVSETREIINRIDWDCQLHTNFADVNLGCRRRMSTGITWALQKVERTIILEDDCLPDASFFPFCEQLLERYANDDQVGMISGDNFQPQSDSNFARSSESNDSYYFSRFAHIWGWATWRRAWSHYDLAMQTWRDGHSNSQSKIRAALSCNEEFEHWSNLFDQQAAGQVDTWDFAWQYAVWMNQMSVVLPTQNLISNLGFGQTATHTVDSQSPLAGMKTYPMPTDALRHPVDFCENAEADKHTWESIFRTPISNEPRVKGPLLKRLLSRWISREPQRRTA